MSLARRAARAALAASFISGGIDQIRNPQPKAAPASPIAKPIADRVPQLPNDPESLVKLDGAIKVVGGLGLIVGPFARPAALLLAGSLVPTTLAGHRFWETTDPDQRVSDRVEFFKNVSLLGGLLITALDTGGRPSVPWLAEQGRARRGRGRRGSGRHGRLGRLLRHRRTDRGGHRRRRRGGRRGRRGEPTVASEGRQGQQEGRRAQGGRRGAGGEGRQGRGEGDQGLGEEAPQEQADSDVSGRVAKAKGAALSAGASAKDAAVNAGARRQGDARSRPRRRSRAYR